jgi:hypothetical protein
MASKLLIFKNVADKDESGEAAKDAKKTFSKFKTPARPKEVTKKHFVPSDRKLALQVTQAIAQLQEAMDTASRAGLIIEPSFKSFTGRFNEFGVSVESYVCSVEIYRKLS